MFFVTHVIIRISKHMKDGSGSPFHNHILGQSASPFHQQLSNSTSRETYILQIVPMEANPTGNMLVLCQT